MKGKAIISKSVVARKSAPGVRQKTWLESKAWRGDWPVCGKWGPAFQDVLCGMLGSPHRNAFSS